MRGALVATLAFFSLSSALAQRAGYSLRFYGNGINDIDRVKIKIDDPANNNAGPPADVGATDFSLEFWMKARAADNPAGAIQCGNNIDWIFGNIIIDRDRFNQDRKFGIAIAGGRLVFGVSGDVSNLTICSLTNVLNEQWHHLAVQRRRADGWMWLYVDGKLEAQANGPDGDISYPDDGVPGNFCGGPCINSDPFLVIGAEKHDAGRGYPSYSGWLDEIRLSNTLRYSNNFARPTQPFRADASTVALYHFDEGSGNVINDVSGAPGGPSNGIRKFGGSPAGPLWSTETPFATPLQVELRASDALPKDFSLEQNYPNPFNAGTLIKYKLPRASHVSISVYSVKGDLIKTWRNGQMTPGAYFLQWDGKNENGVNAAPGLYFCKIKTADFTQSRRMILVR